MNQRYTKPSMKHSAGKWKYFNMNMVELKESQAKDLQHIDSVNKAFLRFNSLCRFIIIIILFCFCVQCSAVCFNCTRFHEQQSSKAPFDLYVYSHRPPFIERWCQRFYTNTESTISAISEFAKAYPYDGQQDQAIKMDGKKLA